MHESDDILSMWAPDVHKVAPSSALFQLILAGAGVALFSGGVYLIKASPPGVPREYYDPTTPVRFAVHHVTTCWLTVWVGTGSESERGRGGGERGGVDELLDSMIPFHRIQQQDTRKGLGSIIAPLSRFRLGQQDAVRFDWLEGFVFSSARVE